MSSLLLGLGFSVITPSQASKLVLLKLVDACDDDGTNIFPAVKTIAKKAQCSERQVQRELKRFQRVGLLIMVRAGGKGPGSTAHYRLDVPMMMQFAANGWPPEDAEESSEMGDTVAPIEKGDGAGAKGDTGDEKGDRACHPTPPLDPSIDPERARASEPEKAEGTEPSPKPDAGLTGDAAWAALVKVWPDIALQSEGLARSALTALSGADRKLAVERVPAFLAFHREKLGKAKLPFLHNYLNERSRWTALPGAKTSPAGTVERKTIEAFSRPWWWLFFDAIRQVGEALRDPRSPASVSLRDRVALARQGIGWPVGASRLEEIILAGKAFVQIPVDGKEFTDWTAALRKVGVDLPRPDKAGWIYVPSQWPPDERERDEALREAAETVMGAER